MSAVIGTSVGRFGAAPITSLHEYAAEVARRSRIALLVGAAVGGFHVLLSTSVPELHAEVRSGRLLPSVKGVAVRVP